MAVNRLLQRLSKGPMLGAEGYLFELERRGWVSIGPFVPEVVIDAPDAVKQLHREFVRAGSDVIEAFTYYGHREKLRLIGKEHLLEELNFSALKIATQVRDEFYNQYPEIYNTNDIKNEIFVAGNISNSTLYFGKENTSNETKLEIGKMFEEQCQWAKEMNVDFIIGETYDSVEEARIALNAIKKIDLNMPCIINFAIHSIGTTIDGIEPDEAVCILAQEGADVVGLNCARGPDTMLPLLKKIKNKFEIKGLSNVPIAALPVCYNTNDKHPTFQSLSDTKDNSKKLCDLDNHQCTRFAISDFTKECLELGVQYLGVCCGGAPHHVRAMAEAMGKIPLSSKYNPNLSLHYALGSQDKKKIDNYL